MSNCSASWASVRSPLIAAIATFALKAGVWFRRARLLIVSPDSQAIACLPAGRNSTYRRVQISGTGSENKSEWLSTVLEMDALNDPNLKDGREMTRMIV